jgi:hypothetical protein
VIHREMGRGREGVRDQEVRAWRRESLRMGSSVRDRGKGEVPREVRHERVAAFESLLLQLAVEHIAHSTLTTFNTVLVFPKDAMDTEMWSISVPECGGAWRSCMWRIVRQSPCRHPAFWYGTQPMPRLGEAAKLKQVPGRIPHT